MKTSNIRLQTFIMILVIVLSASVASAVIMVPTTTTKIQSTSCRARAAAGVFSPFCSSYITGNSGKNSGWRVATGKINLGTPTKSNPIYGSATVLSGLSGLVSPVKSTLTLKEKADIKLNPVKKVGKYQSLVAFIKERDAATTKR